MSEILIEDDEELAVLRDALRSVTNLLQKEYDIAEDNADQRRSAAAKREFERVGVVLATVEGVIRRSEAIKLHPLMARLIDSMDSQREEGLSLALQTLEEIVARLRHISETVQDEVVDAADDVASGDAGSANLPDDLLGRLVTVYKGENIRYPLLRAVTLAQWMLESGRGKSELAKQHLNFGGLKWRPEMSPYATRVLFTAHDGQAYYCKFATVENFINGYWAFLNRPPYSGWEEHVSSAMSFIQFIGPRYTPSPDYAQNVLKLVPEATALLMSQTRLPVGTKDEDIIDVGTIVIDPGHGGTSNVPGSSANNAISASGVKEKKLTLEFALLLQSLIISQSARAGERVTTILTRTSDINVTGAKRAGTAFDRKADLFLSIHFNGDSNKSTRGTETYYRSEDNENLNLEEDKAFATDVQEAVFGSIKALDGKAVDRKVKPDTDTKLGAIGVLNDVRLGNDKRKYMCRSALVEIEFISNPAADKLLVSGPDAISNRTKVMAALARGMRAHLSRMRVDRNTAAPSTAGSIAGKLIRQIDTGKIIFDSDDLKSELLGQNDGAKITRKLQYLILSLSELTPSKIRISSLIRSGADSFHCSGRAVDIGNEEIASALLPLIANDVKIAELSIDELIFDAALAGHEDRNKWNYDKGKRHDFDSITLDAHANHIHFAVTA